MIPEANLIEWRATTAPWLDLTQVEQDLVLSKAVVEIFNDQWLARRLAFRGGTVLHKCHLAPAARYSNDIDLVTTVMEPIGPLFDRLRAVLQWIGPDKTKLSEKIGTITFAFATTQGPPSHMKVKVEINSREHEAFFGIHAHPYSVSNSWFSGTADVQTYRLEELLGTKLRALHQRRKGRDLFDLEHALRQADVDPVAIRDAFMFYMQNERGPLYRTDMERTLALKMQNRAFLGDIIPLLRSGIEYDQRVAYEAVSRMLIEPLPDTIVS